jgi:outer membrane protein TolC
MRSTFRLLMLTSILIVLAAGKMLPAQEKRRLILPEQRQMEFRDPEQLPKVRLPDVPPPPTVSQPGGETVWILSLDEAIRIALANAEVVRIAAGNTAVSTGETIYDPAISNTQIDQNRARFDPVAQSENTFSRINQPQGVFVTPSQVQIQGIPTEGYQSSSGVSKTFITGGSLGMTANVNQNRYFAGVFPLNPQTGDNVELSVSQPLLKGAGAPANLAPILIARINTEQSFFQLKDTVQDLVLSVVRTYWNISYAQTAVWARQQQVEQGREALERAQARLELGFGDEGDVDQARVSYEGFRAALIGAQANLLNQEAVLRNLLELSPSDPRRCRLTTRPYADRLPADWQRVLGLAETYRPDIIELKLVMEADGQQLIYSKNQALPQVNVGVLYRWNGLEGRTPDGQYLSTPGGQFTDWEAGVNFSVPLGLRKERAVVRETELLIARDRANIEQALHAATHTLALNFRNLSQYYDQYLAYSRMRAAAHDNLQQQMADYLAGRKTLYLNVLQAITDWGNAVDAEYQALMQYNAELAGLERQTGTILETHGIRFIEERFHAVGPWGRLAPKPCYPLDIQPGPNANTPTPPSVHNYVPPQPIRLPPIDEEAPPVAEPVPPPRAEPPGMPARP